MNISNIKLQELTIEHSINLNENYYWNIIGGVRNGFFRQIIWWFN